MAYNNPEPRTWLEWYEQENPVQSIEDKIMYDELLRLVVQKLDLLTDRRGKFILEHTFGIKGCEYMSTNQLTKRFSRSYQRIVGLKKQALEELRKLVLYEIDPPKPKPPKPKPRTPSMATIRRLYKPMEDQPVQPKPKARHIRKIIKPELVVVEPPCLYTDDEIHRIVEAKELPFIQLPIMHNAGPIWQVEQAARAKEEKRQLDIALRVSIDPIYDLELANPSHCCIGEHHTLRYPDLTAHTSAVTRIRLKAGHGVELDIRVGDYLGNHFHFYRYRAVRTSRFPTGVIQCEVVTPMKCGHLAIILDEDMQGYTVPTWTIKLSPKRNIHFDKNGWCEYERRRNCSDEVFSFELMVAVVRNCLARAPLADMEMYREELKHLSKSDRSLIQDL